MCGIAGICGERLDGVRIGAMVERQRHRGPDGSGVYVAPSGMAALGHDRLSIIDVSSAGAQPMSDRTGRYTIVFNGEIYNYIELRSELKDYPYTGHSDTEVILAAYLAWGERCLQRFLGMFAFAIWDEQERRLFAARDRFGVKPLYIHEQGTGLMLASEIKALHTAGVPREPDPATWATYLDRGLHEHATGTFWKGIRHLPAGSFLRWTPATGATVHPWYDVAEAVQVQGVDGRDDAAVSEELHALLCESLRLRFRSDVPVGICLSGGLDSSLLLGVYRAVFGADAPVETYTFYCGDERYDETPYVHAMLEGSPQRGHFCLLTPGEIPLLAAEVQRSQDEPFGGFPTLGMAKVHACARSMNVVVLLDGNGLDEGWGGYDYYARAGEQPAGAITVQGLGTLQRGSAWLDPAFVRLSAPPAFPAPFTDPLANAQYRDMRFTKLPRAMRFVDRVSMMRSREVREPFIDHRIMELGLRQPPSRKIRDGVHKWLPRQVAANLMPASVRLAPKRPLQTPQREWLRGPLQDWAGRTIQAGLTGFGGAWLDAGAVRSMWQAFVQGDDAWSFRMWQLVNLGLMSEEMDR